MSFQVQKHTNYTVLKMSTEKLDAVVAPDLKSELVLINKSDEKNIIIDMESVKYCDSSGLSSLLVGNRICRDINGIFIISSLQTNVEKLISISQLNTVLNITSSMDAAVDMLNSKN